MAAISELKGGWPVDWEKAAKVSDADKSIFQTTVKIWNSESGKLEPGVLNLTRDPDLAAPMKAPEPARQLVAEPAS